MEYLTVYGWSVAVALTVLSALFSLGVFSGASLGTSACIPIPGYSCQNPILSTNGMLNVSFSQTIGSLTITGTGCTQSMTPPTTLIPTSITSANGAIFPLTFVCPLSGNTIGTQFSGYLWFGYDTPTQTGLETEFASFSAQVRHVATP